MTSEPFYYYSGFVFRVRCEVPVLKDVHKELEKLEEKMREQGYVIKRNPGRVIRESEEEEAPSSGGERSSTEERSEYRDHETSGTREAGQDDKGEEEVNPGVGCPGG